MATAPPRQRFPYDLVAGFVLLLAMLGGGLWYAQQQAADVERTRQLFQTSRTLANLIAAVRDAEIGQRGYLILGEEAYLAPYNDAETRARAALAELGQEGASARATQVRLKPLIDAKFAELRQTVALRRSGAAAEAIAIVRTDRGKRIMGFIRTRIGEAQERVSGELTQIADRAIFTARFLVGGLIVGLLGLLGTGAMALRHFRRQLADVEKESAQVESAYAQLKESTDARESVEAQLRQVQKMESIGQLTGGIAHDFNNMLAIIIGSLDMAKRRMGSDPAKVEICIGHAREGAERAAALTARLLAFSRQQPLAPVSVEPNRLVSSMSELLRRTLGEEIAVETVLAGGLWRTYVDAPQLENALLNLAVNARDAMAAQASAKLTIETCNAHLDDAYARNHAEVEAGQYVLICVTDTGTGMTPEVMERVFDPFFTTKGVGKGTGLGLSQVFGFVKQSGGHIAVYSEPGEGSTVKLYLPRYTGPVTEAPLALPPLDDLPEGSTEEIILVVEDETRVRHFSVDALRELGYTTLSAPNGAEALRLLAETPKVSMLFTDIVMPEMNGRRLADEARILRPNICVLYTTGYTRNAVVHNGMLDAGVAFLPKPFTIGQLAMKIREVLDGAGINRPV